MIEQHQIDNGKFLIPSGSQQPAWVIERINNFKDTIYGITKTSKDSDPETLKQMVKALEMFILPPNVKLTKKLTKPEIAKLVKYYGQILDDDEFVQYIWLLMNAGFFLSTILPTSIDEDSLTIPPEIHDKRMLINKKFKDSGDRIQYMKDVNALSKEVLTYMIDHDNAFGDFLESKANGSLDHIQELLVGIGFAFNTKGEIIDTITNCLVEGVSQTDYFNKGSTGIGALYAKSSETAKPGYLGKKLSNICEKVKLASERDCGTKGRLKIQTLNPKFLESFIGSLYSTTLNGDTKEFTDKDINNFVNKPIYFRSPLYCRSQNHYVCASCYNQEFIRNHSLRPGDNIGLYASTGLTGSLVSLTLKKSHVGISVKTESIDLRKDLGLID